jgi:hypothetical protein
MIPAAKSRFQDSAFQSYLKKLALPGKQAAQMCLRDDDIPNVLFPKINKTGTIKPIKGPEMYQGHGCVNILISWDRACLIFSY